MFYVNNGIKWIHKLHVGGSSGLLVKVLACNRKVAGSSPTRVRLFLSPIYEFIQLYPQK